MIEQLSKLILFAHLASTMYMVGLIWFVQMVHYPLLAAVGDESFVAYENQHTRRTTWVVAPLMLIEMITAVLLIWLTPNDIALWLLLLGIVLIVIAWLSTALVQMPCHQRLSESFDTQTHHKLVTSNWIRTIAWSLRLILVASFVW